MGNWFKVQNMALFFAVIMWKKTWNPCVSRTSWLTSTHMIFTEREAKLNRLQQGGRTQTTSSHDFYLPSEGRVGSERKVHLENIYIPGQVSKKIPPSSRQHPDKNGNMAETWYLGSCTCACSHQSSLSRIPHLDALLLVYTTLHNTDKENTSHSAAGERKGKEKANKAPVVTAPPIYPLRNPDAKLTTLLKNQPKNVFYGLDQCLLPNLFCSNSPE